MKSQTVRHVGPPLPKESADALRLCIRILLKDAPVVDREGAAMRAENFIREGRWPMFLLKDVPLLFFPNDAVKAAHLREMLEADFPGKVGFFASDVVAWQRCPAVPKDSPLVHWLPAWMQKLPQLELDSESEREGRTGAALKAIKTALRKRIDDAVLHYNRLATEYPSETHDTIVKRVCGTLTYDDRTTKSYLKRAEQLGLLRRKIEDPSQN